MVKLLVLIVVFIYMEILVMRILHMVFIKKMELSKEKHQVFINILVLYVVILMVFIYLVKLLVIIVVFI